MKRKEFLMAMQDDPDSYEEFSSIPEAFRDSEMAASWMTTLSKQDVSPSPHTLMQIPAELQNQKVLLTAVGLNSMALKLIKPEQADDYLAIVLVAVHKASYAFKLMDESYKTEAVLDAFIEDQVFFDLETGHMDWVLPMLNQERIDKISAYSLWFAMSVGLENVSWDVVKEQLKKTPDNYSYMDKLGQLGFLSKMLKEDEWPKSEGNLVYKPFKGLADGVSRFMRSDKESALHYLQKAYVLTFPVPEVIAAMKTPARREVLLGLYPVDVLREHAHGDRNLRGKILEQDIGL
jgi:hypothetical protein